MNIPLVKETQLNVEYSWKTLMCTLLTVLVILHIMQDVTERIVFLDSYVGYIPSLEKIFLSGSEKQPRFKWLTVIKTVLQNHHTVYSFWGASPSRSPALTLRHPKKTDSSVCNDKNQRKITLILYIITVPQITMNVMQTVLFLYKLELWVTSLSDTPPLAILWCSNFGIQVY